MRAVTKVSTAADLPASGNFAEPGQNAQFVARVNGVRVGHGETAVLAGTTNGSIASAKNLEHCGDAEQG
eukprot:COSAG02_NODE_22622_length_746_cov_1.051005_1_plen_69_part_00